MAGAAGRLPPTLAGVETRVTFRLAGDATLTAAAVTRRLGIQPTRALEAGDPVSPVTSGSTSAAMT